ncbi:hypothetical protein CCO04_07770 [Pimelobacter sp. 30-1]|nr:hypothetical protein [Pimelobacter sp. 30-1]
MSRHRMLLASATGAGATAAAFALLYAVVWVPGLVVLAVAVLVGAAAGRSLGLTTRTAALCPVATAALLAPQVVAPTDLVQVLVLGIAALGLQVLLGTSGQLSLAQGTMLGLGGYTTAVLVTDHGWPALATLPVAVVVTGAVGWLLGGVAARFDGVYLVILTGAFAIVVPILLKYFEGLTGGVQGISVWLPESPTPLLGDDEYLYLLVLAATAVAAGLTWNVTRGSVGLALRALHDSPVAARGVGINLRRAKMQAFLVSALLAGLAGGLYALSVGFVSPDSFGLLLGIHLLVMVVLGGSGSMAGAFLGAGAVHLLQVHLREIAIPVGGGHEVPLGPQAVFGLVLVLVLLLAPSGLAGLPERMRTLVADGRRGHRAGRLDDRPSRSVVETANPPMHDATREGEAG